MLLTPQLCSCHFPAKKTSLGFPLLHQMKHPFLFPEWRLLFKMGLLSGLCGTPFICSVSDMMSIIFVFQLLGLSWSFNLSLAVSTLSPSSPSVSSPTCRVYLSASLPHYDLITPEVNLWHMHRKVHVFELVCKLYATWVPGPSRCLVYLLNWVGTNAGLMLAAPSQPLLAHYSLAFSTLFNQTQAINLTWKELPPHPPTSPHWFYILLEAKANFQDSGQHQFQILSASWKRKLWKRHLTFFSPSTWGKIWKL